MNQPSSLSPENPSFSLPPIKRGSTSIRTRLLTLLTLISLLGVITTTIISIRSANLVSARAQQTSAQNLRNQTESYLLQINARVATQNDLVLDRAMRDAQAVAEAAATVYNGIVPDSTKPAEMPNFWPVDQHIHSGPEGQFLNGGQDTSSVFVPNTKTLDNAVRRDIGLSAYLDLVMQPILKNNPSVAAVYFGSANDVTRYYPNIKLGEVVPPDFQVTRRPWYTEAVEKNMGQAKPVPVWSSVYLDATGLGLVTTVAVPVIDRENQLVGVVGLDLTLKEIQSNVQSARFSRTGYSFLVDQDGRALVLPDQGYLDLLGRPPKPDEFGVDLRSGATKVSSIVQRMVKGETGLDTITYENRNLFIAFAPLPSTGWSLGSIVAADDVLENAAAMQLDLRRSARNVVLRQILPIGLALAILLTVIAQIWTRRLIKPMMILADTSRQIGGGEFEEALMSSSAMEVASSGDELGLLARTMLNMADQLRKSFGELEQRVAERTAQLAKRAMQLQVTADVARNAAAIRNQRELLTRVANLISESFGFYHTGIFLLSEPGLGDESDISRSGFAILQAASSEGGQKMLARGHRLKVGQVGIVGHVAATRQPRIALDVGKDAVFFNNPDLPETRSEMALPLIAGERVIGVLDVQSTQPAAFSEEDVATLQILADQVALAIENARLLEDSQKAYQEIQTLLGDQTRRNWQERLGNQSLAFTYDLGRVIPRTPQSGPEHPMGAQAPQDKVMVEYPIELRGQQLGKIFLQRPASYGEWTEAERGLLSKVASQVALALENARLVEMIQDRARREELINHIVARTQASLDLETVLRTAVQEVGRAMRVSKIQIRLSEALEEVQP